MLIGTVDIVNVHLRVYISQARQYRRVVLYSKYSSHILEPPDQLQWP